MIREDVIYFAKDNESVIIPSKREEDAGYDIYANFEGDFIEILPHTTKMIPTGLRSAFDKKWFIQLNERGSTGTKGMAQRCGVIDSGYRGEWMIPITNTNDYPIFIVKEEYKEELINSLDNVKALFYPYEKAICQAILLEVPKVKVETLTVEDLMKITSERGEGKIGSSGK